MWILDVYRVMHTYEKGYLRRYRVWRRKEDKDAGMQYVFVVQASWSVKLAGLCKLLARLLPLY